MILNAYIADMAKYTQEKETVKIFSAYDSLPISADHVFLATRRGAMINPYNTYKAHLLSNYNPYFSLLFRLYYKNMIKYGFQEIGKEIRKDLVKILSHTFNLTEIQSPKQGRRFDY